jgi:hypothetical protein
MEVSGWESWGGDKLGDDGGDAEDRVASGVRSDGECAVASGRSHPVVPSEAAAHTATSVRAIEYGAGQESSMGVSEKTGAGSQALRLEHIGEDVGQRLVGGGAVVELG